MLDRPQDETGLVLGDAVVAAARDDQLAPR
jgi:hypothetical protein